MKFIFIKHFGTFGSNLFLALNDMLPSSLIDSNIKWKQEKSKELGHVPWFVALWGVEGHAGVLGRDYKEWQTFSHSHGPT
jgi:hypothetical protein